MNFDKFSFDSRIVDGITAVGYTTPTPIQEKVIPMALEGRDVMGLAHTGTGKTAAFMLPILQRLTTGPLRRVRALIVAPTRELAEQIYQMGLDLGQNTKARSVPVYGGVNKASQVLRLKRGVEIVVACPGRLLDLVSNKEINLCTVEILVLDEADRMCDMGFLPDIRRILKLLPVDRQMLFFSATMPKEIRTLVDNLLRNPVTIQIGKIAPVETVTHALYPVHHRLKEKLLLALLEQTPTGRVLIFTNTKFRARNLARNLQKHGHRVTALQGNMSQNQRQRAINGFRDGKYDLLTATDVAARGIDISQISHVINFDVPDTVDAYTHRIGRTGRAHQSGEAFTFVGQADEQMIRDLEKQLGTQIEQRRLPNFNYGSFIPEILSQKHPTKPPQKALSQIRQKQALSNKGKNNARRRSKHR